MSAEKKANWEIIRCRHIIEFCEGWNDSWLKYSKSEKNEVENGFCSVRFEYCPRCGIKLIWEKK